MNNIYLTKHSIERLDERYGIEKIEACTSIADRAWRNGKTIDCFSGRMKKFLDDIQCKKDDDIIIKIHAKNCYIFSTSGALITVYSLANIYDEYTANRKCFKYYEDEYFGYAA